MSLAIGCKRIGMQATKVANVGLLGALILTGLVALYGVFTPAPASGGFVFFGIVLVITIVFEHLTGGR